jgi:hypothetical protein
MDWEIEENHVTSILPILLLATVRANAPAALACTQSALYALGVECGITAGARLCTLAPVAEQDIDVITLFHI